MLAQFKVIVSEYPVPAFPDELDEELEVIDVGGLAIGVEAIGARQLLHGRWEERKKGSAPEGGCLVSGSLTVWFRRCKTRRQYLLLWRHCETC
jgi:hypothetical protein